MHLTWQNQNKTMWGNQSNLTGLDWSNTELIYSMYLPMTEGIDYWTISLKIESFTYNLNGSNYCFKIAATWYLVVVCIEENIVEKTRKQVVVISDKSAKWITFTLSTLSHYNTHVSVATSNKRLLEVWNTNITQNF